MGHSTRHGGEESVPGYEWLVTVYGLGFRVLDVYQTP